MGLLDLFRKPPRIRDAAGLADFMDEGAAFAVQKGIYEYARARAGHYAKVLFREPEFLHAADVSRWRSYPIGLAMVAEMVEAELRPDDRELRQSRADAIAALTLAVFDRYPVPDVLDVQDWAARRDELESRLKRLSLHAPKWVKDIPEPYWETYFDLMPIHKKLRQTDALTTRNYLRITLINLHTELTKRIDRDTVLESLHRDAPPLEGGAMSVPVVPN